MASTPAEEDVTSFLRASFGSVWALEVLLFLKGTPDRCWAQPEVVSALRASDSVVERSVETLLAAGLVIVTEQGDAQYSAANPRLALLVDATETMYAQKPDAVRRHIIRPRRDGLSAFADAFRLRRD